MQTLFDIADYHVEPAPDPNRPTAEIALILISEAEKALDATWLQHFQHFAYRNYELWSEVEGEKIHRAIAVAARNVGDRTTEDWRRADGYAQNSYQP